MENPTLDRIMPKIHELNCDPEYFVKVYDGIKLFELRKNDRDYEVGDWLKLREYDRATKTYSGRWISARITFITDYPDALRPGYVALGLKMGCVYGR
jgi:hypothetical protein